MAALSLTMLLAAWTLLIAASLAHAKSGRAHDISDPAFQKCLARARHSATCRRLWGKRSELPARFCQTNCDTSGVAVRPG